MHCKLSAILRVQRRGVPATVALPWPVELADHSFPSTDPGSSLVALRCPEKSGGTWWLKLDSDTCPPEQGVRALLRPAASPLLPSRYPPGRPAFSERNVLSPRRPAGLPRLASSTLRLSHTRLWLARRAKFSAAVGRLSRDSPRGKLKEETSPRPVRKAGQARDRRPV